MAVISYRGPMQPLGVAARFTMALPEKMLPEKDRKYPVLWLLAEEGKLSDAYLRRIGLEALSERYGLAIVCPEGLHSDYEDMLRGMRWYTYISEGLPKYLRENFPLSEDPRDNFVFGFGMGGLGAVRLGLRRPDFAALFGACDADLGPFSDDPAHGTPEYIHRMQTIYGDDWRAEEILEKSDPLHMIRRGEKLPDLALYSLGRGKNAASMRAFSEASGAGLRLIDTDPEGAGCIVLLDFLSRAFCE